MRAFRAGRPGSQSTLRTPLGVAGTSLLLTIALLLPLRQAWCAPASSLPEQKPSLVLPSRFAHDDDCMGCRGVDPRSSEGDKGLRGSAITATLKRGINITGWFRFPVSRDPAKLAAYLGDTALADLRAAGFDFVRLAVDPGLMDSAEQRATLIAAIRRIQRQRLTVVVSPHPNGWHLESADTDRERLRRFWTTVGPELGTLNPAQIVPEVMNEPVFHGDFAGWGAL